MSESIASLLRPGKNVIVIAVTNTGDKPSPAGLIARAHIDFTDGSPITVCTDQSWQSSKASTLDDANSGGAAWVPAQLLGAYGVGPWNTLAALR